MDDVVGAERRAVAEREVGAEGEGHLAAAVGDRPRLGEGRADRRATGRPPSASRTAGSRTTRCRGRRGGPGRSTTGVAGEDRDGRRVGRGGDRSGCRPAPEDGHATDQRADADEGDARGDVRRDASATAAALGARSSQARLAGPAGEPGRTAGREAARRRGASRVSADHGSRPENPHSRATMQTQRRTAGVYGRVAWPGRPPRAAGRAAGRK